MQMRIKIKTEYPPLMYKLLVKIKNLPHLSTLNKLLVEFTFHLHIITYHIILKASLPSTYKFGMTYTLAHRCFQICSRWTKLHTELLFLEQIFLKNGCTENHMFQKFMDSIHIVQITQTIEKRTYALVLPYFGSVFQQTKSKLKKKTSLIIVNCI